AEDLVGDPTVRAQVKRAAAEIAATGAAEVHGVAASSLTPQAAVLNQPGIAKSPIPFQLEPFREFTPSRGGRATTAKKNPVAPKNLKPGDVIQTASEAKAEQVKASGDPEAARQKYFAERPWLKAVASDDDKHDPMSAWQRHRRGKVTSSAAGGLADPETSRSAMHALVKGALTPLEQAAEIGRGSIWTQSGDALEPVALDWYRKNIDPDAFEPGLIFNRNKAGQATTPDAIAKGGTRNVEVKSRNKFIDPKNPLDQNEARTLRKNYMQMQHQMYLTGANSTDLVEILRDPENPNVPLGKNGLNDSNIRRRTVARDDELIRRMRPQWEMAGKAADQIAGLGSSAQKMFAKAVEEGNIQSFEKLSKRHGIEGYEALGATLGLGEGEGGGGKGGRGGRGGGGGNYGGFGGRDAPTTARGAIRGGLSSMGRIGKMANVALSGAEILWNTGVDLNDTGLELSRNARATGMREGLFRNTRLSMMQGRYLNESDAMSDMSSIALAKGGLELGFTDRAVNLVESTRGAITLGDLHGTNLSDPDAIRNLMAQTEKRLRNRGVSEFGIAATMEQSGLKSLLSAADAEGGRESLNNTVTNIRDSFLEFQLKAGESLGTVAGFGHEYFEKMTSALESIAGSAVQGYQTGSTQGLRHPAEPKIPKFFQAASDKVQADWEEIKGWMPWADEPRTASAAA
ncbi:YqaJ viral recombinase family protein, partial [Klebsiella pneumoniae]